MVRVIQRFGIDVMVTPMITLQGRKNEKASTGAKKADQRSAPLPCLYRPVRPPSPICRYSHLQPVLSRIRI